MSFPVTADQKALFLERLASTCNITASAESVGISRGHLYVLRERDPEFAKAWDAALVRIADRVRDAIIEEAVTGVDVQVGDTFAKRRNTALLTKLAIKLGVLDADKPSVAVQTNVINDQRGARPTLEARREVMRKLLEPDADEAMFTPVIDSNEVEL